METQSAFYQKKVLILGLAKSGFTAAAVLHRLGAFVTVNDAKPFEENPDAAELLSMGVTVICGRHPEGLLDEGFELVLKNPGIPYDNPLVQEAMKRGLPVWTEVELAYRISKAPFIGITGSNGKTTTTTLLYQMLELDSKRPLIAGNIGTVAAGVAEQAEKENVIVTELSSFQLKGTEAFRPRIAILMNLYEAHLDYHGSYEDYSTSKFKIAENQTQNDLLVYNADQAEVAAFAERMASTKVPFTLNGRSDTGASADDRFLYWQGIPLLALEEIMLAGRHNLENAAAAAAAALLWGCSKESVIQVLKTFAGVEHRTQFILEWNGRKFYNDSKATNALATKNALEAFPSGIILLAGGLDRGHSFEELRPYMTRVKALVAFGETAERFGNFARECGVSDVLSVLDVDAAVDAAVGLAEEGDTVLLSPACASWDQYKNFEIRGNAFINAVHRATALYTKR
ncbi:UDP-N-acetylmuramoyl-L-alanine--D-glutamate ligase [Planococcus lenghuensis]|uniref:UDP-N-acetylmuramoylalanine--D-glutamate ligase n=1 Tax=Planococcus lenghuensis TaxID=2213202 RepID=A0A1Q2L071_9BACL|nr:UDP-N-acetylmuramoyl-L-alanine--D-glutamate ligase [Planococcus lenghuensis]AQQ53796.1 UDP-N-acetylmuramoyl-L-alanine--D-glutamate ligase [Planococcus lenghuensis]